jgi:SAM-dependent methyltransferase
MPGSHFEQVEMAAVPEIQAIINRDFPPDNHPYRILERVILNHVDPGCTVLDIGCGRRAPNLMQLKGRAKTLIGIDLLDFELEDPELLLVNADVCDMPAIPSGSVDLAYSRSVMEHIKNVRAAYSEINRVLKPGGKYIFLTPNAWDYASIIAYLVPNRFHGKIAHITEGRHETDVFPTFYQSNTCWKISKLAAASNFAIERFDYIGQYPCYFTFSEPLFYIGSLYEKLLERHRRLHFLRGWILCILSKRIRPS